MKIIDSIRVRGSRKKKLWIITVVYSDKSLWQERITGPETEIQAIAQFSCSVAGLHPVPLSQ